MPDLEEAWEEAWEEDPDELVVLGWDLEVTVFASLVVSGLHTSKVLHALG